MVSCPGCIALQAERDALIIRRDELLVTIRNLSAATPYPEEAGNAAVLIAEVGTLRARVAGIEKERDEATARATVVTHCLRRMQSERDIALAELAKVRP